MYPRISFVASIVTPKRRFSCCGRALLIFCQLSCQRKDSDKLIAKHDPTFKTSVCSFKNWKRMKRNRHPSIHGETKSSRTLPSQSQLEQRRRGRLSDLPATTVSLLLPRLPSLQDKSLHRFHCRSNVWIRALPTGRAILLQ